MVIATLLPACSDDPYKKNDANPMKNFSYDKEEGDYFTMIEEDLKSLHINPRDHHFQEFPIKYYLHPMEPGWQKIAQAAIDDFADYFPMQNVDSRDKADLTIEISDIETIQEKFPGIPDDGVSGVGGLIQINVTNPLSFIKNKIAKPPQTKGIVMLLPHAFKQPIISKAIIMHELCHALGVSAHSNDPYDLMYENTNSNHEINSNLITVNGITQTLDEANSLSYRDLNTLWMLYNKW
ncbi:MAG: hypothetical protein AB7V50_05850 [Vampirovibrionia bacterium]